MPDKPSLGFVVLTWNSEKYIAKCLSSIFACSGFDLRVLVVDNGSTDATRAILEKYSLHFKSLVVLSQPYNIGTTRSRNIALKMLSSDCEYVCILDSDTVINQKALFKMISILEKYSDIGLIGPRMSSSDNHEQLSGRNLPTLGIKLRKACPLKFLQERGESMEIPNMGVSNCELQDVPYLLSACWLMRRSLLDKVGYFDEAIFYAPEDADYCIRVWRSGYRVVFCRNAHIIHEYQRISKKKYLSKINLEHIKGLLYFFKKHKYLLNPPRDLSPTEK